MPALPFAVSARRIQSTAGCIRIIVTPANVNCDAVLPTWLGGQSAQSVRRWATSRIPDEVAAATMIEGTGVPPISYLQIVWLEDAARHFGF